ncbi:MAG: DNA mismatch repair endonuclease MutL [Bryobacteraceae bacterium]|nr:DNA mismatch repair endonuclease MutL [Bryobacteraceae bacterium]
MGRIRVLSDAVANKIAAGEVVERPASVVKELLENSLDAGATDIRVEADGGGRRFLRIVDNGHGMLRDDALLAFERHATSKLRDPKDLLSISTLGFRGEALPSIASVSRLLLETRSPDETTGTTVEIAGGKLLRCDESGLASGTIITVRDLFYNVPARRNFLRSEQTELAHIASLVTHYSLAHPEKSFELRHGANDLLSVTSVASLRERVYQVFGTQMLEDLIDLGYSEKTLSLPAGEDESGDRVFAIRGFVSRPQIQKLNRNSIYLFVNGRLIRDRLLLHALGSAYHNLMPASCYPFALLFLDCDCEEVDVNVHPSKTEVRFRHGSFVHDFLRDTIRDVLMHSRPGSNVPAVSAAQMGAILPYSDFTNSLETSHFAATAVEEAIPVIPGAPEAGGAVELPEYRLRSPLPAPARLLLTDPEEGDLMPDSACDRLPDARPPDVRPLRLRVPDTHGGFPDSGWTETPVSMHELQDLRPLGQLHNSFIIAAGRDGLWIIDQHVAHERILFEQVLSSRTKGSIERQQLLMPLILEMTAGQQMQYARIADEMNSSGFDTEPFGNRTVAVKAAPAGIGPAEIEKLVFEILEISDQEFRNLSLDDVRRGIAATIACRAAIKVNMRLDQTRMEWLLTALSRTDFPMACPHGRPIALRYSMREILKSFHRI